MSVHNRNWNDSWNWSPQETDWQDPGYSQSTWLFSPLVSREKITQSVAHFSALGCLGVCVCGYLHKLWVMTPCGVKCENCKEFGGMIRVLRMHQSKLDSKSKAQGTWGVSGRAHLYCPVRLHCSLGFEHITWVFCTVNAISPAGEHGRKRLAPTLGYCMLWFVLSIQRFLLSGNVMIWLCKAKAFYYFLIVIPQLVSKYQISISLDCIMLECLTLKICC